MHFPSHAGIAARVAESHAPAASDSEAVRSMDSDDGRDYADQFPDPDEPDSPGRINDWNLEVLAAVLKYIPECIDEADFERLSDLLPHLEPVHVATKTVQEAIAGELLYNILTWYHIWYHLKCMISYCDIMLVWYHTVISLLYIYYHIWYHIYVRWYHIMISCI